MLKIMIFVYVSALTGISVSGILFLSSNSFRMIACQWNFLYFKDKYRLYGHITFAFQLNK